MIYIQEIHKLYTIQAEYLTSLRDVSLLVDGVTVICCYLSVVQMMLADCQCLGCPYHHPQEAISPHQSRLVCR